jgi:hypothetical protein
MPTVTVLFNDCAADNANSYSLLTFMAFATMAMVKKTPLLKWENLL